MRSPTTPTTHPELHDTLVSLGLHGPAAQLDDLPARVTRTRLSPLQQLEELARIEQRERRHEARRSILMSSNPAIADRPTVFPSATCTVAHVDRLTHRADITRLEGPSRRRKESQERNDEQRKGKK